MHDDRDVGSFGDVLKEADGGLALAAESQPVVRWHEQNRVGACFLRSQRVIYAIQRAFDGNADDHFDGATGLGIRRSDGFANDARHPSPLSRSQRHDLACVTIAGHPFGTVDQCQFMDVFPKSVLVDRFVFVKRTQRGREDAGPFVITPVTHERMSFKT